MCGRAYSTYTQEELEIRYHWERSKRNLLPELKPNFNLSPTQLAPILRINEKGEREFAQLKWGLVPFWAKDAKIGYKMINARSEAVAEKPAYRAAFKSRRCIVPLSGFIEWKRTEEHKIPFKVYLKKSPIMSVAGLWESCEIGKKELQTFTILTTGANAFMRKIHDRMPVLIAPEDESAWLEPDTDVDEIGRLLKPCPASWLEAAEISTLINSPRNNRAEVLKPIASLPAPTKKTATRTTKARKPRA